MTPMPESFTRMVDQTGRPLEWRGRWIVRHEGYVRLDEDAWWDSAPHLPAVFPRSYYKVARGRTV